MSMDDQQPEPVHVSTEEACSTDEACDQTQSQTETQGEQRRKSESSSVPNSIERLRSEFDKLLGVAVEQGERALDRLGLFGNEAVWMPRVDVLELEEKVQVSFDLPGVTAEEINITLAGNMLTIAGSRSTGTITTSGQTARVSERPSGQFRRSVPMPVAVDPDKVTASVQNGILSVELEKSSTEKPRQIPISSAAGTGF